MTTKEYLHTLKNKSMPKVSGWQNDELNTNYTLTIHDLNQDQNEAVSFLKEKIKEKPKILIICGTGLGPLADEITQAQYFPFETIPQFPVSTVAGHKGQMVFGLLGGVPVVCMQGRFHFYEGYTLYKCCEPIRIMHLLGVTHLIVTNAAGGLNKKFKVGDIMLIKDHINMMGFSGNNPLRGPNNDMLGPRFPSMCQAYDVKLRMIAMNIVKELGLDGIQEGVYTCVGGPNFETVAELKMMHNLGVDAIGMSTVHEVITARHCNMTVFAFSLITNLCSIDYKEEEGVSHEDVLEVGKKRENDLKKFIKEFVKQICVT